MNIGLILIIIGALLGLLSQLVDDPRQDQGRRRVPWKVLVGMLVTLIGAVTSTWELTRSNAESVEALKKTNAIMEALAKANEMHHSSLLEQQRLGHETAKAFTVSIKKLEEQSSMMNVQGRRVEAASRRIEHVSSQLDALTMPMDSVEIWVALSYPLTKEEHEQIDGVTSGEKEVRMSYSAIHQAGDSLPIFRILEDLLIRHSAGIYYGTTQMMDGSFAYVEEHFNDHRMDRLKFTVYMNEVVVLNKGWSRLTQLLSDGMPEMQSMKSLENKHLLALVVNEALGDCEFDSCATLPELREADRKTRIDYVQMRTKKGALLTFEGPWWERDPKSSNIRGQRMAPFKDVAAVVKYDN